MTAFWHRICCALGFHEVVERLNVGGVKYKVFRNSRFQCKWCQ